MEINFTKYQGTGNDFILLDNRELKYSALTKSQIEFLCNRRFGIGADGLMLIEKMDGFDFKMVYYNLDGNVSSMCGNGGRCITKFAKQLGIVDGKTMFFAIDGAHEAIINDNGYVELKMNNIIKIERLGNDFILNTGSPHYVQYVHDLNNYNVYLEGKKIRNSKPFAETGINVNFIEIINDVLHVRTYERGVEDETYSCGTGVVASAIVASMGQFVFGAEINVSTKGGSLKVSFDKINNQNFENIWLKGHANKVFEGVVFI